MKPSSWANLLLGSIFPQLEPFPKFNFRTRCQSFLPQLDIYNAIGFAEYIPAGTNLTFPYNDASCNRPSQIIPVDMCRLALSVETSNRSGMTMEVWLPQTWTGRFLGTGNGGIDGCIKYEDLAYGIATGFATVGSNNGHNGTTAVSFYENEDILADYAWRALHVSVAMGKNLTQSFYSKAATKSYYIGCSFGGRQGINSAVSFPDDFDGIVAGSPALDFNNLVSWRASFFPITGSPGSSSFINLSDWEKLVHPEVLRQCDSLDGVADGIIEDPSLCHFRPESIMCTRDRINNCLNVSQVDTIRRVLSPLYGIDGQLIFPAMQPGSEIEAATQLYAGKPFSYSEEWFQYVVYTPSWDPATFTLHDASIAEALNPQNIKTWPNDLSTYRNRGGKIITFHGQQDGKITSFNTARFYNHLSRSMQMSSSRLDGFFRFFRISGMGHCNSGPGAWGIGQGGGPVAMAIPFEREGSVLAALVDWVERDIPPDTIRGTKFVNDTPALGVELQRDHCRYPLRNTYVGGNSSFPGSWRCLDS
ncbi:tannase and feruloyl esterase [Aspergillus ibericus CBS 121593]|uniref:Carboxylic ester hydrolase n=1 Tax=Aspergillus ibericus CBS 121593 TaxID=1448316 RepID=A0A395GY21_9EURO|nr:tannase and feruloyl esterase [Aspergillus ibericus CBS 121593]RAK99958.1 tannase and feruloyl esterase [Aspergillus ibericus CBS 121593]